MQGLRVHGIRVCILTGAQGDMFHIALEGLWVQVVPKTLSHIHLPISYLLHNHTKEAWKTIYANGCCSHITDRTGAALRAG